MAHQQQDTQAPQDRSAEHAKGLDEADWAKPKLTVYYDGACPRCVEDRCTYEKLVGGRGGEVHWFDITGQEERLRELGIDPYKALTELHVSDEHQRIYAELAAYVLLMGKVPIQKTPGMADRPAAGQACTRPPLSQERAEAPSGLGSAGLSLRQCAR